VKPQDPALPAIKGGSLIGAWLLLPYYGLNPFILGDKYKNIYNTIVIMKQDLAKAQDFLYRLTLGRNFEEKIPSETPAWENYIGEPALFNEKIWAAFAHAYGQRKLGNYVKAEIYFEQAIFWAKKVASNSSWLDLARRDNFIKNKEIGGIISYPWGCIYKDNDHYLHYAILRYPLLNEVATAMWALAAANFELGRREEAKYWIGRIITEVPLHQIADTTDNCGVDTGLVRGYWNALVSWEDNPGGYERDEEIRPLYFEVLKAKGLISAKPKLVVLNRN
jgi:tetratricopeptide (TPR) repeat protein